MHKILMFLIVVVAFGPLAVGIFDTLSWFLVSHPTLVVWTPFKPAFVMLWTAVFGYFGLVAIGELS